MPRGPKALLFQCNQTWIYFVTYSKSCCLYLLLQASFLLTECSQIAHTITFSVSWYSSSTRNNNTRHSWANFSKPAPGTHSGTCSNNVDLEPPGVAASVRIILVECLHYISTLMNYGEVKVLVIVIKRASSGIYSKNVRNANILESIQTNNLPRE